MNNKLVSFDHLREMLGVSKGSLRHHIRMGRITPIRLGKRLLFQPEEVLKELKKGSKNYSVVEPLRT